MRILLAVAFVSACVSSGTYNRRVAELTRLKESEEAASKQREQALSAQLDSAHKEFLDQQNVLLDQRNELADEKTLLERTNADKADVERKMDDATQLVTTLKQRLEKLGQNVDNLVQERGHLTAAMADANARLEELRKQKAAAEVRAATFRNLVAKLRSMIDSGQLKVVIRGGRMIIALPNDILFDSEIRT